MYFRLEVIISHDRGSITWHFAPTLGSPSNLMRCRLHGAAVRFVFRHLDDSCPAEPSCSPGYIACFSESLATELVTALASANPSFDFDSNYMLEEMIFPWSFFKPGIKGLVDWG
jgi:hypothetical protein